MSDEGQEDLSAIEKLLKFKLPVKESGQFERERAPSAGRGAARHKERHPETRGGAYRRDEHRPASRTSAPSADPLFSRPYTPSSAPIPGNAPPATGVHTSKKQVAALFLPPVPAEKQDA
jgi:hypothetical protein